MDLCKTFKVLRVSDDLRVCVSPRMRETQSVIVAVNLICRQRPRRWGEFIKIFRLKSRQTLSLQWKGEVETSKLFDWTRNFLLTCLFPLRIKIRRSLLLARRFPHPRLLFFSRVPSLLWILNCKLIWKRYDSERSQRKSYRVTVFCELFEWQRESF